MSDCKAIYRKVKEFVKCLYPGELRGFFHRNLNTLTSMIAGIIIGKETQLPQIANNSTTGWKPVALGFGCKPTKEPHH
jgi:hypothetical protein